jgi:hypothetical protein
MVELLLGGTWTDVTTAALPAGQQYGSIKGGQPDGAQQPSPAMLNATWDNPDYTLSPRNADGPHYGQLRQNTPARVSFNSPYGAYLRLEGDGPDYAYVADTSALHVTGSMEVRLEARLSGYRESVLAAKWDDSAHASWVLLLEPDGTLRFWWYDSGGTARSVTSPNALSVSWKAFRVTLDASNGNVAFYVSDSIDGSWTSLGAAASGTSGTPTTVRSGSGGTTPLTVGWSAAAADAGFRMYGQVYGFRLYDGITTDSSVITDTAGDPILDTTGGEILDTSALAPVADAAFSDQVPGVTTWIDPVGLTWNLSGGAEVTARDYRLYGEVASLAPTADVSSSLPRVQAQLAGRMRRLQQASAPTVDSAMKRAILSQPGSLYPVDYWTMEETQAAKTFGPSAGSQLLTAELGKVQAAADSSFEASAPLPTLNGDTLGFSVDAYSGGTAWAVRFLHKPGSTPPGTAARLLELTTTGACTKLQVIVDTDGTLTFNGFLSGGSPAFSLTEQAFPQLSGPAWWSVEATPSGSNVLYSLVALAPGAGSGNDASSTVTGHGSFGNVTGGTVNADLLLTDTVFGHLSVQKAWASLFTLGQPLNAWRREPAADRFYRVCSEQGIPCRILGRPSTTQVMGPQPRGSAWTILRDCQQTEQGLIFEPRDVFGLALRTRESMGAQQAAVTLSFATANLRGDLQPADDDQGFLNDVTGAMADGTSWRQVLDDGSANSVSEPEDGGRGRYAGSIPFAVNVDDPSELSGNVAFYLRRVNVDEPRYRNVALDFGIDGAPAADFARLRPGDLVVITDVPGIYQTADIEQLWTGWTEAFGPGRVITGDCLPASPYGAPAGAGPVLDTDGDDILDTDGNQILDTGA